MEGRVPEGPGAAQPLQVKPSLQVVHALAHTLQHAARMQLCRSNLVQESLAALLLGGLILCQGLLVCHVVQPGKALRWEPFLQFST